MTTSSLPAVLRVAAEGIYALKAAIGLIIAHGTWLARFAVVDPGNGVTELDGDVSGEAGCESEHSFLPA
jgi:hypothetical protein